MDVWHDDNENNNGGWVISVIAFGVVTVLLLGVVGVWFVFGGAL